MSSVCTTLNDLFDCNACDLTSWQEITNRDAEFYDEGSGLQVGSVLYFRWNRTDCTKIVAGCYLYIDFAIGTTEQKSWICDINNQPFTVITVGAGGVVTAIDNNCQIT